MILPLFLRFQMCHRSRWMPTLWFPIFLLWPFLFLLALPLFILTFVGMIFWDPRSLGRTGLLFAGIYRTLCQLRGTRVEVIDPENRIFISVD